MTGVPQTTNGGHDDGTRKAAEQAERRRKELVHPFLNQGSHKIRDLTDGSVYALYENDFRPGSADDAATYGGEIRMARKSSPEPPRYKD